MKKVILYRRQSCSGSRKAKKFLVKYGIPFIEVDLDTQLLGEDNLLKIVQSTENGFTEVLKVKALQNHKELEKLSVPEMLAYLIENLKQQNLIKTPILMQGEKIIIGSKQEEMRGLLPRALKKQIFEEYLLKAKNLDSKAI